MDAHNKLPHLKEKTVADFLGDERFVVRVCRDWLWHSRDDFVQADDSIAGDFFLQR
jgi:hypothetical protein